MKCPSCGANSKGKFCEYCGSELPKEKSTVNITNNYYYNVSDQKSRDTGNPSGKYPTHSNKKGSRRRTWLWVLGWIFIFPVPLTILLLRKKNMKPVIKYGIIAIAWLLFIVIGLTANNETEVQNNNVPAYAEATQTEQQTDKIENTVENEMLNMVNSFNASSEVQLVFAEDFIPSDKSSSHYRTEFRLGAYSDAIGKSYTYNETLVDIVGKEDFRGEITIRVYMDGASLDQCVEMVKYVSPIMDSDIDYSELQKAIDYIKEYKSANGYYYADLGLLLMGNDTKGYEFMLKMGND